MFSLCAKPLRRQPLSYLIKSLVSFVDAVKNLAEDAICTTDYGIHVVPGSPAFVGELGSIDVRGILDQLRKKYDVILLDSAPGFGPEVYASMKACDELVIVCQPQVPAIAGTLQTFRAAGYQKLPIIGTVINRVTGKRYEIPISHMKKILRWPIIGVVPEDDMVPESTTRAIPLVVYSQNSPAAVEFRKIAQALLTHIRGRRRVAPRRRIALRRRRKTRRKIKSRKRA
jgi:MinD-like ATPase involved in chromosome partitioning or flagellar assembly